MGNMCSEDSQAQDDQHGIQSPVFRYTHSHMIDHGYGPQTSSVGEYSHGGFGLSIPPAQNEHNHIHQPIGQHIYQFNGSGFNYNQPHLSAVSTPAPNSVRVHRRARSNSSQPWMENMHSNGLMPHPGIRSGAGAGRCFSDGYASLPYQTAGYPQAHGYSDMQPIWYDESASAMGVAEYSHAPGHVHRATPLPMPLPMPQMPPQMPVQNEYVQSSISSAPAPGLAPELGPGAGQHYGWPSSMGSYYPPNYPPPPPPHLVPVAGPAPPVGPPVEPYGTHGPRDMPGYTRTPTPIPANTPSMYSLPPPPQVFRPSYPPVHSPSPASTRRSPVPGLSGQEKGTDKKDYFERDEEKKSLHKETRGKQFHDAVMKRIEQFEAEKARRAEEQKKKRAERVAREAEARKTEKEARKAQEAKKAEEAKEKARVKAEREAREAKERAEREAKKAEQEAKKAEQEAKKAEKVREKAKAAQKAKEAEERAEQEAKKAEKAKEKARVEAEEQEARESKERAEQEARKTEQEAKKKTKAEEIREKEKEAKKKADRESRKAEKAEREALQRAEKETKRAEQEARIADQEAKLTALREKEKTAKAEQEAKSKADREARKAEKEAQEKAATAQREAREQAKILAIQARSRALREEADQKALEKEKQKQKQEEIKEKARILGVQARSRALRKTDQNAEDEASQIEQFDAFVNNILEYSRLTDEIWSPDCFEPSDSPGLSAPGSVSKEREHSVESKDKEPESYIEPYIEAPDVEHNAPEPDIEIPEHKALKHKVEQVEIPENVEGQHVDTLDLSALCKGSEPEYGLNREPSTIIGMERRTHTHTHTHKSLSNWTPPDPPKPLAQRLHETDRWFYTDHREEARFRHTVTSLARRHEPVHLDRSNENEGHAHREKQMIMLVGDAIANLGAYVSEREEMRTNYFSNFADVHDRFCDTRDGGSYFEPSLSLSLSPSFGSGSGSRVGYGPGRGTAGTIGIRFPGPLPGPVPGSSSIGSSRGTQHRARLNADRLGVQSRLV